MVDETGETLAEGKKGRARRTRAVYQFPMLRVVHLICHDQREKRDGLAGARRHLQDAVAACVQGACR